MSMSGNKVRLGALTKELLNDWRTTRDYWHDAKAREFEQRFIEELLTAVNAATGSLERLDKIITKVRNDCE